MPEGQTMNIVYFFLNILPLLLESFIQERIAAIGESFGSHEQFTGPHLLYPLQRNGQSWTQTVGSSGISTRYSSLRLLPSRRCEMTSEMVGVRVATRASTSNSECFERLRINNLEKGFDNWTEWCNTLFKFDGSYLDFDKFH
jgi:hypothetical protein